MNTHSSLFCTNDDERKIFFLALRFVLFLFAIQLPDDDDDYKPKHRPFLWKIFFYKSVESRKTDQFFHTHASNYNYFIIRALWRNIIRKTSASEQEKKIKANQNRIE